MAFAGPQFAPNITFQKAQELELIKKTTREGASATGYVLRWPRGVPSQLDQLLLVPWCLVDTDTNQVYIPSPDREPEVKVWCRVPRSEQNDNEQLKKEMEMTVAVVHLYFNFWLKNFHLHRTHTNQVYSLGPTIPLLDVQLWDKYVHTVMPIFKTSALFWLWGTGQTLLESNGIVLLQIFWPLSTLIALLLLHATGVMHLDLSYANLFYIDIKYCLIKYRNRELLLPFVPLITDFDSHAFGWTNFKERSMYETTALRALVLQMYVRCEQYKEIYEAIAPTNLLKNKMAQMFARSKKMFIDLFNLIDTTNDVKCDTCINFLFDHLQKMTAGKSMSGASVVVQHNYTESIAFEQFYNLSKRLLSMGLEQNCPQYRITKLFLNPGVQMATFLNNIKLRDRHLKVDVTIVKFVDVKADLFQRLGLY